MLSKIRKNRGAVTLATGLLALTGGLAIASPPASAAASTIYTECPTSGSEWIDYADRGRAHATCSGADVRVKVYCANGREYNAPVYWGPDYNRAECPKGVGATKMYTQYRK
ncbi:hypothetical protein GCM10012286_66250 [Streptomyces lasiicapitis]|uniref:Secreted protein n=1 Tax=Streptomyces lasiicapitis TaxID=1923961 RepID=A0ABQ2MNH3_9ACTN|nr:hypothetical protein GCM10012286_66250 [Streptomyces lasiicapitis]